MAELADVGRAGSYLALLVDDRRVVLGRRSIEGKGRPAVFEREQRRQRVVDEPGADLRLEGIDKELRMAVEEPVGRVATVLVHRAEHEKPKIRIHRYPFRENLSFEPPLLLTPVSPQLVFGIA